MSGVSDGSYNSTITMTGSVQPILTWAQDAGDNNAPPPAAKVYVLIAGSTYAANMNRTGASADDGLGDAPVTDSSGMVSSRGTHLVQIDNSSQSKTLSLQTYNISAKGNGYYEAVGITATIDGRSVTLACPDLETYPNYSKDPVTNARVVNKRASDGSMTVDTVIGDPSTNYTGTDWALTSNLQATTTGFDFTTDVDAATNTVKPRATISWNFSTSSGATYVGGQNSDLFTATVQAYGAKNALWAAMNANVKVTDNRPSLAATAENHYLILIHTPLENIQEIAPRVLDHNEKYPWSQSVSLNGSASVSMVAQQARQWEIAGLTTGDVGALLSGICGSGSVALYGELVPGVNVAETTIITADMAFNAIGWAISKTGNPEPSLTVQVTPDQAAFNQAISEQKSIEQGATPDQIDCSEDDRILPTSVRAYVYANPTLYFNNYAITGVCHSGMRYVKVTEEGDAYNAQGYAGRKQVYPIIPTRFLNKVWQFTIPTTPPPPNH